MIPGRGPWPDEYRRTTADRVRWLEILADEGAASPILRRYASGCVASGRVLFGRAPDECILRAVQYAIAFRPDECADCYQTPVYTFAIGEGDCNALACLAVALARSVGLTSWRIAWLPQPGARLDHVACRVGESWAEPSVPGALIGEHPYDAAARLAPEVGRDGMDAVRRS